jgi:hypothetical protein
MEAVAVTSGTGILLMNRVMCNCYGEAAYFFNVAVL